MTPTAHRSAELKAVPDVDAFRAAHVRERETRKTVAALEDVARRRVSSAREGRDRETWAQESLASWRRAEQRLHGLPGLHQMTYKPDGQDVEDEFEEHLLQCDVQPPPPPPPLPALPPPSVSPVCTAEADGSSVGSGRVMTVREYLEHLTGNR